MVSDFKKDKKVDLLTDIDMLLIVKKVQKEEYVTLNVDMQRLTKNTGKIMMKIKNRHIFHIEM